MTTPPYRSALLILLGRDSRFTESAHPAAFFRGSMGNSLFSPAKTVQLGRSCGDPCITNLSAASSQVRSSIASFMISLRVATKRDASPVVIASNGDPRIDSQTRVPDSASSATRD